MLIPPRTQSTDKLDAKELSRVLWQNFTNFLITDGLQDNARLLACDMRTCATPGSTVLVPRRQSALGEKIWDEEANHWWGAA